MSRNFALIAAAAAGILAGVCAAEAGSDTDRALFGRDPGKDHVFACYTRHYTMAHLKSHPKQNTVDMTVFVDSYLDDDSVRQYALAVGVHFRPSQSLFHLEGGCSKSSDGKAGLGCGIDCDGGTIGVAVKDANAILVEIPDGASTWDPGSSEEAPENARFGVDDKMFKLERTDVADCLPLVFDEDVRASIFKGM